MRSFRKLTSLVLSLLTLFSLAACSGGGNASSAVSEDTESSSESRAEATATSESESSAVDPETRFDKLQTTTDEITLYIHLGMITPTVNSEPTESDPDVFNSTRTLATEWANALPNKVSFDFSQIDMNDSFWEWIVTAYNAGIGPDILYIWGDRELAEYGWYFDLTDAVNSPNYYEPGSPVWKDMLPDYMWEEDADYVYDTDGHVISYPLLVSTGALTGYFYNADLLASMKWDVTTDWDDFMDMCEDIRDVEHHTAIAPSSYNLTPGFSSWEAQFSILPAYSPTWTADNDRNGDGSLSTDELIQATYRGYYYLENNASLVEAYQCLADKYQMALDPSALETDYTQAWYDGDVAFLERSMSDISMFQNDDTFDFTWGVIPMPVKQDEENSYLTTIEYTEAGPYEPAVTLSPSVMEPSVQGRPAYYADYSVDFLKYLTVTENLNTVVSELNGKALGAVKTCMIPAILATWYTQRFPILPTNISRPARPNLMSANAEVYQGYVNQLANGEITMDDFISLHDQLMYKDLNEYLANLDADLSEWGTQYVPKSVTDAEMSSTESESSDSQG